MSSKISPLAKLFTLVILRAIYFTVAFLVLEMATICLVYHNEAKDLRDRVMETSSKEGNNIYLICNYINCEGIIDNNIEYINTGFGLVVNEKEPLNKKIVFAFFNSDMDTIVNYGDSTYIVSNDNKWAFINRLMALSTIILFISIFILSFKLKIDNLKIDRKYKSNIRNDLESKLQRDLTESLHHEMGTPLAIIKVLMAEIVKTLYPCDYTSDNICSYIVKNKTCTECEGCKFKRNRRSLDSKIASYYEQLKLATDTLLSLQNIIGKSKKIAYSNGTVSLYEIINNVITTSNHLRIKNLSAVFNQKGILDTHSCRGIHNGEMLIIINNMILNAIEANATIIKIGATINLDFLEVTLEDNGGGIRDANNQVIKDFNIFKYGYSTKDINGDNIINKNWLTKFLFKIKLLARDNEYRGAGLSLCKDLLKKNGGDIELLDTSKNGTIFKLRVPVKVTHSANSVIGYLG